MVEYNGNAVAKRFIINKQWGGAPARATIQFTGVIASTLRSPIAVSIGAVTFHGVVKNTKQVTSEREGIDVTHITYEDRRVQTKWRWIKAAFNIKNDQGIFVHIRPEDWGIRIWKVFVEDSENPGIFIFKDFSDYKESEDGLALRLTAEQIFEFIRIELNTDGLDFDFEFSKSALTAIQTATPDDLNWLEGQSIYNAMVKLSEKAKIKYRTTNFVNRFRFNKIDVTQVENFGADKNIPSKSFGISDTFTAEEVCIIGDNDLHELFDIPLGPNWNQNFNKYFSKSFSDLDADITLRLEPNPPQANGVFLTPPKFMPEADAEGNPPPAEALWFDPDFGDPPATPEDRLTTLDYVKQNVYKNYKLPEDTIVFGGPFIGIHRTQDLLPINESHGLISQRSQINRRPHKVKVLTEQKQLGNKKVPLILVEEFTEDYVIINKERTKNRPPKAIVLFSKERYNLKPGGVPLFDQERQIQDWIPATPELTAIFPVGRYTRIVGSGEIKSFHKVSGLFNEFIGATPVANGSDDFADELGASILSKVNVVNTGTIKRVGTTFDLDTGIQSLQATLDGVGGVQQNLNLTDQRPGGSIVTAKDIDDDEFFEIIKEEPIIVKQVEIPKKDLKAEGKDLKDIGKDVSPGPGGK